jgi:hypothetical protein
MREWRVGRKDEKDLAEKLDTPMVWYNLGNGYARLEQAAPAVAAYLGGRPAAVAR